MQNLCKVDVCKVVGYMYSGCIQSIWTVAACKVGICKDYVEYTHRVGQYSIVGIYKMYTKWIYVERMSCVHIGYMHNSLCILVMHKFSI